ncbi:hypothetical protein ACJX0J_038871 [Zea mays]
MYSPKFWLTLYRFLIAKSNGIYFFYLFEAVGQHGRILLMCYGRVPTLLTPNILLSVRLGQDSEVFTEFFFLTTRLYNIDYNLNYIIQIIIYYYYVKPKAVIYMHVVNVPWLPALQKPKSYSRLIFIIFREE